MARTSFESENNQADPRESRGGSIHDSSKANSGTSTRIRPPRMQRGRHLLLPIVIQTIAVFALGALLYPNTANWFSSLNHNTEISGYIKSFTKLETDAQKQKTAEAVSYNSSIPQGVLRDPYANNVYGQSVQELDEEYQEYLNAMKLPGRPAIGEVRYPKLKVDLPIYHGTDDETISKGAGHLYGSSLPVGGDSTHALLTAHSGLSHAKLFTPILKAEIGDEFQIVSLGETKHYKVTSIENVLPEETGRLGVIAGKDLVTLITCTPLGVNTHRLLVQGERIPAPALDKSPIVIEGNDITAGIPWWAIIFIGTNIALFYMLFAQPIRRARTLKKQEQTRILMIDSSEQIRNGQK